MTDYKALVGQARDYQKNSHRLSKGDARTYAGVQAVRSITADFIGQMADAVEALVAENEALRSEWADADAHAKVNAMNASDYLAMQTLMATYKLDSEKRRDEVNRLVAERDALRAQLDAMTTEFSVGWATNPETDSDLWGLRKRRVGAWEVTD